MSRSSKYSRLRERFNQLAGTLRRPENTERCRRYLAHWTSLSDRSVPFALLEKQVIEIVRDGFDHAASQPGIGINKLGGLVVLLERVASSDAAEPMPAADPSLPSRSAFAPEAARFRHNARSHMPLREVDWDAWRRTLYQRNMVELLVGRCLARLRDLPISIWSKPLSYYAGCSLQQLFALPMHGNRRIAAVADLCRRLAEAAETTAFSVVGRPALITRLLLRLNELRRPEMVRRRSVSEIRQLLLRQIEHDLGPQAADVFAQLTDAKSNLVRPAGWNRHYRRSIRFLTEVRCPELFAWLDEFLPITATWPPLQRRSVLLLRDVLAS